MKNFFTLILTLSTLLAQAASFTVSNTNPSGAGSFSQAILDANAAGAGSHTIDITATGNAVISSAITIAGDLTINGPSEGGFSLSGNNSTLLFSINTGHTVTINRVNFINGKNTSSAGGAIFNSGSTLTINNCTFSGNQTSGQGGAIWSGNAAILTVTNSTFKNNSSDNYGGAIANYASATVTNCTFAGNTASAGGAVANYSTTTLINCTITGNSPDGLSSSNSNLSLSNTIVSGNGSSVEIVATGSIYAAYSLFGNTTGVTIIGFKNKTSVAVSDIFGTNVLTNNGGLTETIALKKPGFAADSGTSGGAPATDQRGISRDSKTDIGAFEALSTSIFDHHFEEATQIYSNPSSRIFHMDLDETISGNIDWTVLSSEGKIVARGNARKGNNLETYIIDLGNQPSGIYNLIITNGSASAIKQLVKY